MKKYFVSSDIHSFYFYWREALNANGFQVDNPEHIVVICGDLFDRGDYSQNCFDFIKLMHSQNRLIYIRGNHEDLLIEAVNDIQKMREIGRHHISNGTIKTISQITDINVYNILCYAFDQFQFNSKIRELIEFINEVCVDYYVLGNYIFTHGYIPCRVDNYTQVYHRNGAIYKYDENWKNGNWNEARWICGFDAWRSNVSIPDHTIVFGHWHNSYGHSLINNDGTEWGPDSNFKIFKATNKSNNSTIVGLDACTAYTNNVNCFVIDENEIKRGNSNDRN